jgi:hypothetical protein
VQAATAKAAAAADAAAKAEADRFAAIARGVAAEKVRAG